jgi:hypothetical protein
MNQLINSFNITCIEGNDDIWGFRDSEVIWPDGYRYDFHNVIVIFVLSSVIEIFSFESEMNLLKFLMKVSINESEFEHHSCLCFI